MVCGPSSRSLANYLFLDQRPTPEHGCWLGNGPFMLSRHCLRPYWAATAVHSSEHSLDQSWTFDRIWTRVARASSSLSRMAWIYPGAQISNWIQVHIDTDTGNLPPSSRAALFALGWAGMRDVVALAAIAARKPQGRQSVFRSSEIIFLTYCVIFVTLVLQEAAMPALIRGNGSCGRNGEEIAKK